MRDHKFQLRILAIVVTIVSVAIYPMVTSIALADNDVHAEGLGQPIDFTPNVKQLELTSIAATAVAEGINPPPLPLAPGQLYRAIIGVSIFGSRESASLTSGLLICAPTMIMLGASLGAMLGGLAAGLRKIQA